MAARFDNQLVTKKDACDSIKKFLMDSIKKTPATVLNSILYICMNRERIDTMVMDVIFSSGVGAKIDLICRDF
jgi:hypothetical protein